MSEKWIDFSFWVSTETREYVMDVVKMQLIPITISYDVIRVEWMLSMISWDWLSASESSSKTADDLSWFRDKIVIPVKHPTIIRRSNIEILFPRRKNPRIAVQKGAVLKTIADMKMGKYLTLKTIQVNPVSPATHLKNSHFRFSTGTSLTKCFPDYATVKTERERLMNVLMKQRSITLTPELVATLAIDW